MLYEQELTALITHLGHGEVLSVAYDTAWLARLSRRYPDRGFERAYPWLRAAQHNDGSWGSQVPHLHDHIICTLAAVIALQLTDDPQDQMRVQRGLVYVDKHIEHLSEDANDTINFVGLMGLLLLEARTLGLRVPDRVYHNKHMLSTSKLEYLRSHPEQWANHPIAHSLECFQPSLPNVENLINANGSVGVSPATTAAILLNSTGSDERLLGYLQRTQQADGGIPTVAPIDIFEITWALNALKRNHV